MCFSETWLNENDSDYSLDIEGFTIIGSDRTSESGKQNGGGVCFYFNQLWANKNNIHVKEQICNGDIELLSVYVRPYYLPREFTQVIFTLVYIHPKANATVAEGIIYDCLQDQASDHPDAVRLIKGDFNHCNLKSTYPHLEQYVTCPTRQRKTLDLCYGNVKKAYKSTPLPSLGESDHNNVLLTPSYKPAYKRTKPTFKTVCVWTRETAEELKDCFGSTDWDLFVEANNNNIDKISEVVTDYINYCSENIVPTKRVKCFSNNKPWLTKGLKTILNEKKQAFKEHYRSRVKHINKELKKEIARSKKEYKTKIEGMFHENKSRDAWLGMKIASGQSKKKTEIKVKNEPQYANDLNTFYSRFDKFDFKDKCKQLEYDLRHNNDDQIEVNESDVCLSFRGLNLHKASGPDKICGNVLRSCFYELAGIFTTLFNLSLRQSNIPTTWKTAEIIPVPKKTMFTDMNNLRPVALTPIILKCFEQLVLKLLKREVEVQLDPLKFAYKTKRGVEDAVLVFVNNALKHMESPKTFVRILFIDFSSAFNTIQPHIINGRKTFVSFSE